jgi:hypothetical protein
MKKGSNMYSGHLLKQAAWMKKTDRNGGARSGTVAWIGASLAGEINWRVRGWVDFHPVAPPFCAGMSPLFELAPSGRSKCRGCGQAIERSTLRFGERLANPFGEGEMTVWFHPMCAAYKRPEALLLALEVMREPALDREALERTARKSLEHPRLQRIDGAEKAPTGQAKCRHCYQAIERGGWRFRLVFWEEGRFVPGGFVHLGCCKAYFATSNVLDAVIHFSVALDDSGRDELRKACLAIAAAS